MTSTLEPPIVPLDERAPRSRRADRPADRRARTMGYQPGLDGIRAVSVIAVILYHAGFGWMHGGFFGVEVFFVVSGFLITTLLIEEREGTGEVSLRDFWLRRARRLLPALVAVLVAVAAWTAAFGSAEQASQLRRDLPWSIFYAANWGQILGDVPYFTSGDPPLLRHLWSLAVEEQWYLIWPLVFLVLAGTRLGAVRTAGVLLAAAFGVTAFMWWVQAGGPGPLTGPGPFEGADRTNFMYLSTITRSAGLLLGAAAAFVWRPWRSDAAARSASRPLDIGAGVATGSLLCTFAVASLTADYVYQWLLPLVSVLSLVLVLLVVHPAAAGTRSLFSQRWLVEIGKRSYGLYLWHWPIFVVAGALDGSVLPFVVATAVTIVVTELSYRYLETPIRKGALGRWWSAHDPRRPLVLGGAAACVTALALFYVTVEPYDPAVGGDDATFELTIDEGDADAASVAAADGAGSGTDPTDASGAVDGTTSPEASASADPAATTDAAAAPAPTEPAMPAELPVTVAVVGDSQAHSLAINLPDGIEDTFVIRDESSDGCSVHDSGRVVSERSFRNDFSICRGWQDEWADAGAGADVVLVVLGAWDVFDLEIDGEVLPFASAANDAAFTSNLRAGIERATSDGARVALLEVPCMRPVDVEGAGVPALPERGDDARVAHVNDLLRAVADADPAVTFVDNADEWCADESIATSLGHRWDGVHVYVPGAELIYETIAPDLLRIAA